MAEAATSIKIPLALKSRIERLARNGGESPHAFMLRALQEQAEAAERYQAFLEDGIRADEAMQRSGLGYAAADVHAYLESKVSGRRARKPRPVHWRG